MTQFVKSARGELVDFQLLAIKHSLASSQPPKQVEDRKKALEEKDGLKTTVAPDLDFMALSSAAANTSEAAAKRNLKRK